MLKSRVYFIAEVMFLSLRFLFGIDGQVCMFYRHMLSQCRLTCGFYGGCYEDHD